MYIKDYLKPGMLVQFHNGDIAIVCLSTGYPKRLLLSWNDNSGRSLNLDNYLSDLSYNDIKNEEFDIDKIYDVGAFIDPFNMNVDRRCIIWSRKEDGYSQIERSLASTIRIFINSITGSNKEIILKKETNSISISNPDVQLSIPEECFINLSENKMVSLDDIIYGKVLQ